MFEDSASHRRQLKKMRSGNRRKMAAMKFQVEKSQQELMLQQQMAQFQLMIQNSLANDGVIDSQEDAMLQQQMANIQNMINQMKAPSTQPQQAQQLSLDPKALGLDRQRVFGVPVGPSLVPEYNMQPVASAPTIPAESISTVPSQANLMPSGASDILHTE